MSPFQTVLILDASGAGSETGATVALLRQTGSGSFVPVYERHQDGHEGIGQMAAMAAMAAHCLKQAEGLHPDLITVVVGPGSFTGLRTSCALAEGLAAGMGCPVAGVTRGEVIRSVLDQTVREEKLAGWFFLCQARRGRWFVETSQEPGAVTAVQAEAWDLPAGEWLLAGDAADEAGEQAGNQRCRIAGVTKAEVSAIAAAGVARMTGQLPSRPALPLYVDPPEAKLPRNGLRGQPR